MNSPLRLWYQRYFSDPQVLALALLLVVGVAVVVLWGRILAPLIAAVIIAFLLDAAVERLACCPGMPRLVAVGIVFTLFMALVVGVLLILAPLVLQQAGQLLREVPAMLSHGQQALMQLSQHYPALFSEQQALDLIDVLRGEAARLGQRILSLSLASLISVITLLVYLVLVPLLVFFFLKDKALILAWLRRFLPVRNGLVRQVWREVHAGLGSYVRGKFLEILIVWFVTWVTFLLLGMNYAMLLSVLVGLSVIIPYVGAAVVTIPVAVVAYLQWGLDSAFWYALVAYGVIQFLDGNLLVPLLFSEVVKLHPVAIIAAVLFFGGLWGLWGVFFAIPLATVVKAVLHAWPRRELA